MPQAIPNLHHLELFYHVARSGGITAATRSMPYGIQQPAVSGQISTLESELGVRLFQRRPFKLTHAGTELYQFIEPFFSRLPTIADRIAGKASKHLRISAPVTLIRDHLPGIIGPIRQREPDLELSLVESTSAQSLDLLENEQVDLAIIEHEGKIPTGVHSMTLASLPLVILLPPGLKSPRGGLQELVATQPLIRPSTATTVTRLFNKGLAKLGLDWPSRIEVNSIDLVNTYAAGGFGCGLSVSIPGLAFPRKTTVMPLPEFPKLVIAGIWKGKPHPLASELMEKLKSFAGANA